MPKPSISLGLSLLAAFNLPVCAQEIQGHVQLDSERIARPQLHPQTEPTFRHAYAGNVVERSTKTGEFEPNRITTYFDESPSHQLFGWYTWSQNGLQCQGTLLNARIEPSAAGHLCHFRWKDKDGSGDLDIRFAADYSNFIGVWRKDHFPDITSTWTGTLIRESGCSACSQAHALAPPP